MLAVVIHVPVEYGTTVNYGRTSRAGIGVIIIGCCSHVMVGRVCNNFVGPCTHFGHLLEIQAMNNIALVGRSHYALKFVSVSF